MQQFIQFDPATNHFICQGEWDIAHLDEIKIQLKKITRPHSCPDLILDGEGIHKIDSAGIWLINEWVKKLQSKKNAVHLKNFSNESQKLFSLIEKQDLSSKKISSIKPLSTLASLGQYTLEQARELHRFLNFIGKLTIESVGIFLRPARVRWRAIANIIDQAGYQALPIITLLSFMIGIVITYQMSLQLRNYGANIFIVDFLGLAVLREFGPLLTAIMVAGRTGSAFTAQLGTMKINQEIDALNTMGITPAELLLLPRIIGLFIVLPLLTIWANIFGVIGGIMVANNMLGISWHDFLNRFQHQIPLRALIIGLGKAPVFALLIGSIGCFQGMEVSSSADSVGKRTTRSVVLAIFFIIVADALFSIIFSKFNL